MTTDAAVHASVRYPAVRSGRGLNCNAGWKIGPYEK